MAVQHSIPRSSDWGWGRRLVAWLRDAVTALLHHPTTAEIVPIDVVVKMRPSRGR